jgi:hypothetical protein
MLLGRPVSKSARISPNSRRMIFAQ